MPMRVAADDNCPRWDEQNQPQTKTPCPREMVSRGTWVTLLLSIGRTAPVAPDFHRLLTPRAGE